MREKGEIAHGYTSQSHVIIYDHTYVLGIRNVSIGKLVLLSQNGFVVFRKVGCGLNVSLNHGCGE